MIHYFIIYIYIYLYIYKVSVTFLFNFGQLQTHTLDSFLYIDLDTESHQTLKITTAITNHTPNAKTCLRILNETHSFQKTRRAFESALSAYCFSPPLAGLKF